MKAGGELYICVMVKPNDYNMLQARLLRFDLLFNKLTRQILTTKKSIYSVAIDIPKHLSISALC